MKTSNESFYLYDLKVTVVGVQGNMVCSHKNGDYFLVSGENLTFPKGRPFSMYALSALLPLLPAKQRETDPNDWMTTDQDISCPDPNCGAIFRIVRMNKREFKHSEVTVVPLRKEKI